MTQSNRKALGRLVAVHPISPAHLQRAVLLAILSLVFFLTMMFAFYLLKNLVYFLLATSFLTIYLTTMYSFVTAKKRTVKIFNNGLRIGKISAAWTEVVSVDEAGTIEISNGKRIEIPQSTHERDALLTRVRVSVADE